jgi:hypothetical protein
LKEAFVKKLFGIALLGLVVITARVQTAGPIVGYISDEKCALSGAKSAKAAEWIKPAAFESCVKDCLKQGSEAVFVTEDNKVLKLDAASKKKVESHVGHKVSVTGKVEGTTLKVDTIADLKLQ